MLLERVDGVTRVTRAWKGQTVVCVATGPSLTAEQLSLCRVAGLRAIAVNDSYLMAPWADVVYFADQKWWSWHRNRPEWLSFAGQKCTITSPGAAQPDAKIHTLRNLGGEGLSLDSSGIMTGANSGYQAINIAVLSGAKRVLMLGYDCKQAKDGKKHWFGDHPDKSEPPYQGIRRRFDTMIPFAAKLGVEIVNCTPGSWIECFPMMKLEEALSTERLPDASREVAGA